VNYLDLVFGVALLISYVILFYNHHLTGRKALLYYSLAWLSLSVPVFSSDRAVHIVGLAFFSAFLWAGNIEAIRELTLDNETARSLVYLSIVPVLFVFLTYPEHGTYAYLLIGLWIVLSGVFLGFYGQRRFLVMSVLQGVFGSIVFLALFVNSQNIRYVHAFVGVSLAFESVRVFMRSSFVGDFSIGSLEDSNLDEKPGLFLVSSLPENVLPSALVFSRTPRDSPNWFWITNIRDERAISPTNLPKILDMAVKFMKEAKSAGKKPIVVIDGLDYLVLENGLPSVLKFLSSLRDYSLMNDATVFIVGSDEFLSERERTLLKNIIGEGNA